MQLDLKYKFDFWVYCLFGIITLVSLWLEKPRDKFHMKFIHNKIAKPFWWTLIIIMVVIYYIVNYLLKPDKFITYRSLQNLRSAVYLGIIGFIVSFFNHMGYTITMFFIIAFVYFHLDIKID